MGFDIGMLEWQPSASGAKQKRIRSISTDGATDTTFQSNYNIYGVNRFDSINLSGTTWQVCAFWNSALNAVIGVRNSDLVDFTLYVMDGGGGRPTITRTENDNHNTIIVGLDSDGYLHISYDHHNVALKYRKSTLPISSFAGAFNAATSMTGVGEASVAYPMFQRDPQNKLYFMHRSGVSGGGDLYLKVYSTGAGTWSAAGGTSSGKVIDGINSSPDQNPYWNGPLIFTSDFDGAGTGYAYLSWAWRETADTQTMHDMSVVRWNGVSTWTKTDGSSQTMPVTLANCEIVDAFGQNHSYTSFNTQVVDSTGAIHIFYCGNDAADSENSKLWHAYKSGGSWTKAVVAGGAGFQFSLNGPLAVIDSDDTIRVVVVHATGVGNGVGIYAYVSAGNNYASWTLELLASQSTMGAEGSTFTTQTNVAGQFDRYQWQQNGIFRMMVPIRGYWKPTTDNLALWSGYLQATADSPSGNITDPTLRIVIDSSNTQFWAAVASDGKDIRVADSGGQQFPFDLVEWNYAGQFALITFMRFGDMATGPTIRVYAGNGSETAPAASDTFGQYAAYHPDCWGYWPSGGGNDRTQYVNNFTMTGSPSAAAATGIMGETTYDYNGSSQYGLTSTKVVSNVAMTMMINARSTSNTLSQFCLCDANGATTGDYRGLQTRGSDAGDPVAATSRFSAGTANDSTKVGYTINTWCHIGGIFDSGSSQEANRIVYLDGVAGTANTAMITTPTGTRIGIAVLARSALDAKFVGKLANAQMWLTNIGAARVSYDAAMNNQATFWNGWSWISAASSVMRVTRPPTTILAM